jgi:hypothetical protein
MATPFATIVLPATNTKATPTDAVAAATLSGGLPGVVADLGLAECSNIGQAIASARSWILDVGRKLPFEQPIGMVPGSSECESIFVRSSMLRKAIVFLAMLFVLSSSGLSSSAFARGSGPEADGLRGNAINRGFGATAGDGNGGYSSAARGLHGGFPGHRGRDVWGHWGAYYGPMIPVI